MSQFDPEPPAISRDFDTSGEPPKWPKVVGIISIVWGSLGVVCNSCSLAGGAMQGMLVNMVPPEQREQMKQQIATSNTPLGMAAAALSMLAGVLLLYAGIQTVQRKANGRMLHLVWAIATFPLAVIGGIAGWQGTQASLQQMQNDPNAAQIAGAAQTMGVAMFVCMMVLVMVWPIFVLVWFGPMGKRPEAGAEPLEPLV